MRYQQDLLKNEKRVVVSVNLTTTLFDYFFRCITRRNRRLRRLNLSIFLRRFSMSLTHSRNEQSSHNAVRASCIAPQRHSIKSIINLSDSFQFPVETTDGMLQQC
jgi:hypothetical protein